MSLHFSHKAWALRMEDTPHTHLSMLIFMYEDFCIKILRLPLKTRVAAFNINAGSYKVIAQFYSKCRAREREREREINKLIK